MATRAGPFQDQTGRTYYTITGDDGVERKEYVNTSPSSSTTTISMDGSVVQPQVSSQSIEHIGTSLAPNGVVGSEENTTPLSDLSDPSYLPGGSAQPGQNYYPENPTHSQTFGSNYDNGGNNASSYYTPQAAPAATGGPPVVGRASGPSLPGASGADSGGSDTGGYRQQVTVPETGATAGPFGVQPARPPSTPAYGSSGPDLPSSGGGGGSHSAMGDKLRAKGDALAGKVRGMAEGAGGGPDPEAAYKAQQQRYRQQGRRVTQATRRWDRMQAKPNYLPVRGTLKRLGYNEEMASSVLGDPQPILESVLGRDMSGNNRADQFDRETNWTDLALLSAGTGRKKALTSKTPQDRMPGILRRQGWDQPKPESKRVLDPSKVANEIRDIYAQHVSTGEKPSGQELLGNLAGLRKNSAVGTQLRTTAKYDPAAAIDSVRSLISSAVMGTRPTNMYQNVLQRDLDTRLGSSMDELAGHKANKITRGVRNVANSLLTRGGLV